MSKRKETVEAGLKIREANGRDIPAILHLINNQANTGKLLKRTRKDVRKNLREFFVAIEDGRAIGCCAFDVYSEKLAEIRSLVVEERNQGRGVATALIERCLEKARRKKIYEVMVITDRESIFRRFGFSEQLQDQKALFVKPPRK